jgi:probable rRNA maturation factor
MNDTTLSLAVDLAVDIDDDEQQATVEELLPHLNLEQVIEATLQAVQVAQPVTLSALITDDKTIQALNKQYRHLNKPTDVLSFPLLDKPLVSAPPDQLWMNGENGTSDDDLAAAAPPFIVPDDLPTNLGDIVISWPTVQRQAATADHSATYELLFLLAHGVLHLVGYDDQSEAGYQEMVRIQQSVLQGIS